MLSTPISLNSVAIGARPEAASSVGSLVCVDNFAAMSRGRRPAAAHVHGNHAGEMGVV